MSLERTREIRHEIGARGSLSVRNVSGKIQVKGVPGGEVRVLAHYHVRAGDGEVDDIVAAHPVTVVRENDALQVEAPAAGKGALEGLAALLRGRDVRVDFEVEMPLEGQVRLSTVSGSIVVSGLLAQQHYVTVSGDIDVSRGRGEMEVRTVSGDAHISAEGSIALEASTTSGDVRIAAPLVTRFRVTSVSGDVALEGVLAGESEHAVESVSGDLRIITTGGLALSVRGLSGSVRTDLPHRAQGSGRTRTLLFGSGTARFGFRTVSGEARVERPTAGMPSRPPLPAASSGTRESAVSVTPTSRPRPAGNGEVDELAVLRALERGEIDVEEATRRLGGPASGV